MSDTKIPVVIDCDPGTDDIFALMLARKMDNLDVRAITTVAGNVELEYTTDNALKVAALCDWDVPVARGASKPLCCRLVTAAEVHGANGMHGLTLPECDREADVLPAWDMIYEQACLFPKKLVLVAVGPFTNVALALRKHPDLAELLDKIVVMGGSQLAGNTTIAAEFNVYVDPEAAEIVLHSGVPVYVCPLDLTHKAYITPDEIERISALGSEQATFLAEVTRRAMPFVSKYSGGRGVPLHDPCAVFFVSHPELFEYEMCSMVVETADCVSRGKTISDMYSDRQLGKNNAYFVHSIDRDGFLRRVFDLMSLY